MNRKGPPPTLQSIASFSSTSTIAIRLRPWARRRASRVETRSPVNSPNFVLARTAESVNSPFPAIELFLITSMTFLLKLSHLTGAASVL